MHAYISNIHRDEWKKGNADTNGILYQYWFELEGRFVDITQASKNQGMYLFFQSYHLSPFVTWFIKLRAACEKRWSAKLSFTSQLWFKSCSLDVQNHINNTTQLLAYVEMFLRDLVTEYHINATKMSFVSHHSPGYSTDNVSVKRKPILCCAVGLHLVEWNLSSLCSMCCIYFVTVWQLRKK